MNSTLIFYGSWKLKNFLIIVMCLLFVVLSTQILYAATFQTLPGSRLTNIASGDYVDARGNVQLINSNPVSLIVQEVYAFNLVQDQSQVGTIGSKLNFPHTLLNIGNTEDHYTFSLSQSAGDAFDLTGVALYVDRDQDGLPDDNTNLLGAGHSVALKSGEAVSLVVVGTIPSDRQTGEQAIVELQTQSITDNSKTDTVTDTVTVVDDAVFSVTKSQSISTGASGTEVTYTLTYTNTGTAARKLTVEDVLDTRLQYQSGTASWSNGTGSLTDVADGDEVGANMGVDYRISSQTVSFDIASVPALSTGSISFKVSILPTATYRIPNSATYTQYGNDGSTVVNKTATNTVYFDIQHQLGVVTNMTSSSASNLGNPDQSPDNFLLISSMQAGTEVFFDNYIWNIGEAVDTYNLSLNAQNLPSCATVRLYAADGRTLLTDSTNNGVIDTGPIAPSATLHIRIGVYAEPDCESTSATPIILDLTATSATNTTISDPVRNQLSQIELQGGVDLYNNDMDKLGLDSNNNGNADDVDNNGGAWITQLATSGQHVVFPLEVFNSGASTNNYDLYASDVVFDLNNPANSLPEGWSVKFYEPGQNDDCTLLGVQITNTGAVSAGGVKAYCAVVSIPPDATAGSSLPIWFAVKSPVNGLGDVVKDQVNVLTQRGIALTTDHMGQVEVAGTVVYLHTLTNTGNLTEGDTADEFMLSLLPKNTEDQFNYTLFVDTNNNGELDETDLMVMDYDLYTITQTQGLAANESLQLLIKVEAPSQVTNGEASLVTLTATITGDKLVNGEVVSAPAAVSNTDLTTVNSGQLRLNKAQALDLNCNTTDFQAQSYVLTAVQVKPEQCVIYRLIVKNEGDKPVQNIVINDSTPAYTSFRTTPVGYASSQGSVVINDDQISGNVGTLQPNEEAYLYFVIRVAP